MQNKAPERIYLQCHKASERTSIMWTEYPEKNKTQIDIPYIRADLVERFHHAVANADPDLYNRIMQRLEETP